MGKIINGLIANDYIPSFCTACYRLGRTGEHFMEFSVPGFIKRYCTPNAMLTLTDYLVDYATPEQKEKGFNLIEKNLQKVDGHQNPEKVKKGLKGLSQGRESSIFRVVHGLIVRP